MSSRIERLILTGNDGKPCGTAYRFVCPGCGDNHQFTCDRTDAGSNWNFSGTLERPTFSPSLLVRCGHYARQHNANDDCWCNYEKRTGKPAPFACYQCHSFVTDGRIQFLGDCSHKLAGQTVDLPEIQEVES